MVKFISLGIITLLLSQVGIIAGEVQVEVFPYAREYHLRVLLNTMPMSTDDVEVMTTLGRQVKTKAKSIPGVVAVYIKPYSVSIFKGQAFTFEEIEAELLPYLQGLED